MATTKFLAFMGSLLMATALTPAGAADMTSERALNPQREPQNWILHHGNYQGHRFSALTDINAETVKNLKPVFTVALSGFQSGGRYAFGNLEATPLVEDGTLYVPDGWGSVYAVDVSSGKKGVIKWAKRERQRAALRQAAARHSSDGQASGGRGTRSM